MHTALVRKKDEQEYFHEITLLIRRLLFTILLTAGSGVSLEGAADESKQKKLPIVQF